MLFIDKIGTNRGDGREKKCLNPQKDERKLSSDRHIRYLHRGYIKSKRGRLCRSRASDNKARGDKKGEK
jgi:hypothetical protein